MFGTVLNAPIIWDKTTQCSYIKFGIRLLNDPKYVWDKRPAQCPYICFGSIPLHMFGIRDFGSMPLHMFGIRDFGSMPLHIFGIRDCAQCPYMVLG